MRSLVTILLYLLGGPVPQEGMVKKAPIVQCDSRSGHLVSAARTEAAKRDTRRRVANICKAMGFSRRLCVYMDVIVCRESACGVTTVRHTSGPGEDGLGPMGLSLKWQANKWPGRPDPEFCIPEVSAVVAAHVIRNAYFKYGSRSIVEIQSIYGGRFHVRNGRLRPLPHTVLDRKICARMRARGIDCRAPLGAHEFGRAVPMEDRRAFAWGVRVKAPL